MRHRFDNSQSGIVSTIASPATPDALHLYLGRKDDSVSVCVCVFVGGKGVGGGAVNSLKIQIDTRTCQKLSNAEGARGRVKPS